MDDLFDAIECGIAAKRRGVVVVVTGGRDFTDGPFIFNSLDQFDLEIGIAALYHGGANGVDNICGQWAWDWGVPCFVCSANWKKYPKSAGPIRNHWMKDFSHAEYLLSFPGKRGTAHMTAACEKIGMKIRKFTMETAP